MIHIFSPARFSSLDTLLPNGPAPGVAGGHNRVTAHWSNVSHPKCKQKFGKIFKFRIPGEELKLSFGLTTGLERVLKLLLTDCFTKRGKLWFSIFYLCVFSFLGRNSINKLQLLPTFGLRNRLRFGLLLPWRGSGLRPWPRVPRLHELQQRVRLLRDPGPPPLHDRECPQENGNVLL